jgi:hypothetical protein
MSATIDATRVAAYLGGCPAIEVPGRLFPLEISYHPGVSVEDAVIEVLPRTSGAVLCFLAGAPEIRRAGERLGPRLQERAIPLLPLRLPIQVTEVPVNVSVACAPGIIDCTAVPPLHANQSGLLCTQPELNVTTVFVSSIRPSTDGGGVLASLPPLSPPPQETSAPASSKTATRLISRPPEKSACRDRRTGSRTNERGRAPRYFVPDRTGRSASLHSLCIPFQTPLLCTCAGTGQRGMRIIEREQVATRGACRLMHKPNGLTSLAIADAAGAAHASPDPGFAAVVERLPLLRRRDGLQFQQQLFVAVYHRLFRKERFHPRAGIAQAATRSGGRHRDAPTRRVVVQ